MGTTENRASNAWHFSKPQSAIKYVALAAACREMLSKRREEGQNLRGSNMAVEAADFKASKEMVSAKHSKLQS